MGELIPKDLIISALEKHKIWYNKETPATRQDLMLLTGMSDRRVRETIRQLRREGYRIVSTPKDAGYYMAETEEDLNVLLNTYREKAIDMFKTYWILKKGRQTEGQININDIKNDSIERV